MEPAKFHGFRREKSRKLVKYLQLDEKKSQKKQHLHGEERFGFAETGSSNKPKHSSVRQLRQSGPESFRMSTSSGYDMSPETSTEVVVMDDAVPTTILNEIKDMKEWIIVLTETTRSTLERVEEIYEILKVRELYK